jgi:hypothetical protein
MEPLFICFVYNHNNLQSPEISPPSTFAFELPLALEFELFWDQLEHGTRFRCRSVAPQSF